MEQIAYWLLSTLFYVAIAIFVYQKILAPSWRAQIRFDMFALRDRLRRLLVERPPDMDIHTYQALEGCLNTTLGSLRQIDPVSLWQARTFFKEHPDKRAKADAVLQLVRECRNEEYAEIWRTLNKLWFRAYWVNSIPMSVSVVVLLVGTVVPILLGAFAYRRLRHYWRKMYEWLDRFAGGGPSLPIVGDHYGVPV